MKYLAKVSLKTKNKNIVIFKRTLLKHVPCIKEQQIDIYSFGTKGFNLQHSCYYLSILQLKKNG